MKILDPGNLASHTKYKVHNAKYKKIQFNIARLAWSYCIANTTKIKILNKKKKYKIPESFNIARLAWSHCIAYKPFLTLCFTCNKDNNIMLMCNKDNNVKVQQG